MCEILSPFDCAFEVWLADGVVVYEDCGTGAVFLRQWTRGHMTDVIYVVAFPLVSYVCLGLAKEDGARSGVV